VVLREGDRDEVSKLPMIQMHSPLGFTVPLAEVVSFQRGMGPSEIKRISQERTIQVFAKIFDRSLVEVTSDINRIISRIDVAEGYAVNLAGASLEVEESFNSLKLALILSVILVYMIMAAQFESYFQPFIIMFTLPLAIIGVVAALWVTHTPISVIVLLGIMFLGGIVVNNGIILIDFMNQMRADGISVYESTLKASTIRFRPIMMTAMTSILGLLPLALGLGEGVKLLSPMGVAQMGGLLVSTFLTLLVIPAIYLGSMQIRDFFARKRPKKEEMILK
jgi:hydrophobic/amphiphilic exporter-1 (mainly G- bacteria), HAE1 family